jgi:hypothetical protein
MFVETWEIKQIDLTQLSSLPFYTEVRKQFWEYNRLNQIGMWRSRLTPSVDALQCQSVKRIRLLIVMTTFDL